MNAFAWYEHRKIRISFNQMENVTSGCVVRFIFTDMKMSSSMYEVFNWNCTPDTLIIPAKSKRASLSLPPKTIFSIDDLHQETNGESFLDYRVFT